MSHQFLLETGRWRIQGRWWRRTGTSQLVEGFTKITWDRQNWFTMSTKLIFPETNQPEVTYDYRGHLNPQDLQYTYVLKQSLLGKIEGEGWIATDTIIQRYSVLGDAQRRAGFETYFRLDEDLYQFTGGISTGHYLNVAIEAQIKRL
ncbi:MAG: hypothetical protein AAGG02_14630 [Cyanobacteria bacterium P01_H01_bin.15]